MKATYFFFTSSKEKFATPSPKQRFFHGGGILIKRIIMIFTFNLCFTVFRDIGPANQSDIILK